jgi:hypothetical protein
MPGNKDSVANVIPNFCSFSYLPLHVSLHSNHASGVSTLYKVIIPSGNTGDEDGKNVVILEFDT